MSTGEAQQAELKPRDAWGWLYVMLATTLTTAAIWLSTERQIWIWIAGQILLSLALLQWFALLHEAGHKTLFRTAALGPPLSMDVRERPSG